MKRQKKGVIVNFFSTICIMVLCFLVAMFAVAYAFFSYSRTGKEKSKIKTANLNVLLDDDGRAGIAQIGAFPVYDEVGRNTDPYVFTLKNLGTIAVHYKLKLVLDENAIEEDACKDFLLSENTIKVQLIKAGVVIKESLISELDNYELDSGFLGLEDGVNKAYPYELRLWLDSSGGVEVMGKHYHGRIDVEIIDPVKIS